MRQPPFESIDNVNEEFDGIVPYPSLSVVIPTRNEGKNIGEIIDMLLRALPASIEAQIIIANNSDPNDQTEKVVEILQTWYPGLDLTTINTPCGVSNARNGGAAAAKHEYIFFLDADTRFAPGTLRRALIYMMKERYDAAGFNFEPNTDNLADHVIMAVTNRYQNIVKHTSTPVCTAAALLVRKDAHESIGGFDPAMTFGEDSDYAQRLVRGGKKFGIIPEKVVFDMSRFASVSRARFIQLHIKTALHYVLTGKPAPEMVQEYQKNRKGHPYNS